MGHFKPLFLPGGDKATLEPWRIAAGVLHTLGRADEIERRFSGFASAKMVRKMLDKNMITENKYAGCLTLFMQKLL